MKLPTIYDADHLIGSYLSKSKAIEVFVMKHGKNWRLSTQVRKPGAMLVGRFNSKVTPMDLLEAAIATIPVGEM